MGKIYRSATSNVDNTILRTDLALEFGADIKSDFKDDFVKQTAVRVDEEFSQKIGKPVGNYITVETKVVREGDKENFYRVSEALSKVIKKLANLKDVLIVGLGNPDMTADSLGKRVLDKVMITRHLETPKKMPKTSGIYPNVLGVTGIESFDVIKGVVSRTKPKCILAIDSLAGATVERVGSAFQISDAGITPGSGISNHRTRLDEKSMGRPVISIGVPLVVYASTIIHDAYNGKPEEYCASIGNMVVTPKDIDLLVTDCASIIASAINLAYFDTNFDGMI